MLGGGLLSTYKAPTTAYHYRMQVTGALFSISHNNKLVKVTLPSIDVKRP